MSRVIRGALVANALVLFVFCCTAAFGQQAKASDAQSDGWREPLQLGNCSHCEKLPLLKPEDRLPIHHPAGTKLTAEQLHGADLFFQRCFLCHIAKPFVGEGLGACCSASLGPNLVGMFKTPDEAKAMRQIISNGMPPLMPAWKYGLTPKDIGDIVAYIKTLD